MTNSQHNERKNKKIKKQVSRLTKPKSDLKEVVKEMLKFSAFLKSASTSKCVEYDDAITRTTERSNEPRPTTVCKAELELAKQKISSSESVCNENFKRDHSGVFDFEVLKKGKNYTLSSYSHSLVLILYALVFRFYCFSSNIYWKQRFANSLYSVNI